MLFLTNVIADLRFSARLLGKNWGVFVVGVLSLALGIGATSAIFSLVYAVLIDPYPYRNADRIVAPAFSDARARTGRIWYTTADFLDIKAHSSTIEDAFLSDERALVATTGLPERVKGFAVSANFFEFMGVPTLVGRAFSRADAPVAAGPPDVAVISYLFWQRRFGGDPKAVGKTLELNRKPYLILGVLPPRFTWGDGDAYIPLAMILDSRKPIALMARIKPGVGLAAVDAELQALTTRFAQRLPQIYPRQFKINVQPLNVFLLGKFQGTLIVLMTAVGFLLSIACANVAILLLARASTRKREIALRISLGAPRTRVLQQLLTESVVLALTGGVLGLAFAYAGVPAIVSLMPEYSVPHEAVIHVNGMVLLFTIAVSVGVGILFGMAPALQLTKDDAGGALEESGRSFTGSARGGKTRSLLIVAEVALTTVLLAGAGIAIRGFIALTQTRLGFDPSHVLLVSIDLPEGAYSTWESRSTYFERIADKFRNTPGVLSAAASTTATPPWIGFEAPFDMPGLPADPSRKILIGLVDDGYFSTMHIPLLAGRLFSEADLKRSRRLAVINDEMRRHYWPDGRSPIGLRIHLPEFDFAGNPYLLIPPGNSQWFEVAGVVATARNRGLGEAPMPAIYVPFTLVMPPDCQFLVRAYGDPRALIHDLTAQVHAVDPVQPVTEALTLDESLARSERAYPRFSTVLFTIFASVGLLLAGAGIYSVVSYVVANRTHEFGIRMALGARGWDVLQLVIGMLSRLMLMGVAAGLVSTLVLGRVISGYVTSWNPNDPVAWCLVIGLLLGVGFAAAWFPSRRAIVLEPMAALRRE